MSDNNPDVRKRSESQDKPPVWDMSQERAFIENLLVQRFNFLLMFTSIFIGGALNATDKQPFLTALVLTFGMGVSWALRRTIARSQQKLDLILDDLMKTKGHPVKVIDDLAGRAGSARKLIGYTIPTICAWTFTVSAAAAWLLALGIPKCFLQ